MTRTVFRACALFAGCALCVGPVFADTYNVIFVGKVMLPDGSPPPVTMGIQRFCSDNSGSAPGPITNKKGEYTWRVDVDPLATRACYLQASAKGYQSTQLDVSSFIGANNNATIKLDPIIVTPKGNDPEQINVSDANVPAKAGSSWKAAMKAMDASNEAEMIKNLQAAVQAAPKFAQGWDTLGIVLKHGNKIAEAREAFQQAIEADPKYVAAYVSLARVSIKLKDWDGAAKAAESEIKMDPKHTYIEIYLHQAVARYEAKDLDGAIAAAQECVMLDKTHVFPRAEYIWGRALEAKGEIDGARQHMTHYLEIDKAPPDLAAVKVHIDGLGKPGASGPEPELENI